MSDYSAMELLFRAIEKPISQLTLCDFLPKKITRNQLEHKNKHRIKSITTEIRSLKLKISKLEKEKSKLEAQLQA